MTKALLVAGTGSGTGKTTVVLGLLAAARQAGMRVQSFKSGPDFIDPGLHELVTGEAAHTLDPWMMGPEAVAGVLSRTSEGTDLMVVEGAMGLFDGGPGSAAYLARLLGLPVFLVVDGRGMGASAAAVVLGFARYDEDLNLSGVFLNRLGGSKHERLVAEAVGGLDLCPNFRIFSLPRRDDLTIPSRHLGLMTRDEYRPGPGWVEGLAHWFSSAVDIQTLVDGLP
ncbi:MAG: cobyrinate a,c-diamide synthase, partial [Deltaproteobacteria bacterium]|nr:cobyrinate a,c-diamide synthase [Deltaproteobacteria bacterium]